ncbi:hypothetical protein AB5I41_08255 [Sphingomonas sp. MMS24-JH45]
MMIIAALTDAGFAPGIVTGSGTGTHAIDLSLGVFTELQTGSDRFTGHAISRSSRPRWQRRCAIRDRVAARRAGRQRQSCGAGHDRRGVQVAVD